VSFAAQRKEKENFAKFVNCPATMQITLSSTIAEGGSSSPRSRLLGWVYKAGSIPPSATAAAAVGQTEAGVTTLAASFGPKWKVEDAREQIAGLKAGELASARMDSEIGSLAEAVSGVAENMRESHGDGAADHLLRRVGQPPSTALNSRRRGRAARVGAGGRGRREQRDRIFTAVVTVPVRRAALKQGKRSVEVLTEWCGGLKTADPGEPGDADYDADAHGEITGFVWHSSAAKKRLGIGNGLPGSYSACVSRSGRDVDMLEIGAVPDAVMAAQQQQADNVSVEYPEDGACRGNAIGSRLVQAQQRLLTPSIPSLRSGRLGLGVRGGRGGL